MPGALAPPRLQRVAQDAADACAAAIEQHVRACGHCDQAAAEGGWQQA